MRFAYSFRKPSNNSTSSSHIAWRVLYVTMLGREYPNMNCETLFDKAEWQTLYIVEKRRPPLEEPPALSVIVLMLAKLGGFLGRKHDGFPGHQPSR